MRGKRNEIQKRGEMRENRDKKCEKKNGKEIREERKIMREKREEDEKKGRTSSASRNFSRLYLLRLSWK